MKQIPSLTAPPGYDYETVGPWFVAHVDSDGHAQTWVMHVFTSAILRFWLVKDTPERRVIVDVYGMTVMASDSTDPDRPLMSGTRQACEATLALVKDSTVGSVENQAAVLAMIEGLRALDGQAL